MAKDWREQGVPYNAQRMTYLTYREYGMEFVPATDFSGELLLDGYTRGQSAATIWWTCADNGNKYPMFLGDFVELAKEDNIVFGIVKGEWKFVKRGSNYGIAMV